MKKIFKFIVIILILFSYKLNAQNKKSAKTEIMKTNKEWKVVLSDKEFEILRNKGTEAPFTGIYNKNFEDGTYYCKGCNTPLFKSNSKFDSHCGWPSFDDAIKGNVTYTKDNTHGMIRTEITCTHCGGHLGHVFNDGPKETTGKRYCVNSASLNFKKEDK